MNFIWKNCLEVLVDHQTWRFYEGLGDSSKRKEIIKSGQIIATSHDLTPNGGLVREIPLFQGNLGWRNIRSNHGLWCFFSTLFDLTLRTEAATSHTMSKRTCFIVRFSHSQWSPNSSCDLCVCLKHITCRIVPYFTPKNLKINDFAHQHLKQKMGFHQKGKPFLPPPSFLFSKTLARTRILFCAEKKGYPFWN